MRKSFAGVLGVIGALCIFGAGCNSDKRAQSTGSTAIKSVNGQDQKDSPQDFFEKKIQCANKRAEAEKRLMKIMVGLVKLIL